MSSIFIPASNLDANGGNVTVSENGLEIECDVQQLSDGYHTFDELYLHRHMLYLAFLKYHSDHQGGWKSRLHHDGSGYDGWFQVGTELNGKQISYHLPDRLWDKAWWLKEYDRAPVEWDGHTSNDVLTRLGEWLGDAG